ncbi:helix-turn-helix domain-containing protein [Aquabacterium humicola]|uniref:helix-turn-helix domain-containing protein n=1 Tax=Aquabacterium humicola TaxID=3237377 RepID=UPI002542EE53|nr:AraC family transcriptional regulator [Rubrivivax pictus]
MQTQPAIAARAPRRPVAGVGRVLLWSGGSLWIGRQAGRVETHAHHALQLTVTLDGNPYLLRDDTAGWTEHHGSLVMPHCEHQFDGCGGSVAHLFVEPETVQGRALLARHAGARIADLPPAAAQALVQPLRHAHTRQADDTTLAATARAALAALVGPLPAPDSVDPRIARVLAALRERLADPLSLADAAGVAHLSPSRFRHLFVAQTGISFRAWLLWARVERAVAAAMGGQSWTAAAMDAGFADSAHLSRTCRRMFGIAPATLVREAAAR